VALRPAAAQEVEGIFMYFRTAGGWMSRTLIATLIAFLFATAPARADLRSSDPQSVVRSLIEQSLSTLQSDPTLQGREAKFKELLGEGFEMTAIARFCMGVYWQKATERERQDYLALFPQYIARAYTAKFGGLYQGQTFNVVSTRQDGKDGVWVASQMNPAKADDQPVKVNWRLRQVSGQSWKVIDVVVDNISMVVTQRDEFVGMMQQSGSVATLLDTMRDRLSKQS
jgi:phospholipid transport system substrate-binding protein